MRGAPDPSPAGGFRCAVDRVDEVSGVNHDLVDRSSAQEAECSGFLERLGERRGDARRRERTAGGVVAVGVHTARNQTGVDDQAGRIRPVRR